MFNIVQFLFPAPIKAQVIGVFFSEREERRAY
jgi:hypothetical protein